MNVREISAGMFLGLVLAAWGEDFAWSWDQRAEAPEPQSQGATTSAAPAQRFTWSWEQPRGTSAVTANPVVGPPPAAYEELIRENLALRKQIEEVTGRETAARQERERLAREVRDLESRIAEFAARIEALQKERTSGPPPGTVDPDRLVKLEAQLAAAERQKEQMERELAALRQAAAMPERTPSMTAAVQPGSDLYRQLEKENAALREELGRVRAEKEAALRDQARVAELGQQVQEEREALRQRAERAEQAERKYREALQKIMDRLPSLERELVTLRDSMKRKESALTERERELETMQAELNRREQRLVKAERMLALLARTQMEVMTAADAEKRDMHYNMGLTYAKEGRYREAEREYLKALRIDPSDASTHYNLAILYDDALGDKRRAAMHYRKYLSLNPHGEDVDQVRLWLMHAELQ